MRSLVLIRDHRRQLPWSSRDAVSDASTSRCSPTALAIDPVHGTGFLLLAREGRLLACDPEAGCVWTADLDAAVAEGAEGEEELAAGADDGTHLWLAALHLAEQETVLCVHRSGALVLVDGATGEASLAGVVGPGGVLAAGLAPDEELLVFVTGAGVLLGMTPGLEVLYETPLARPLAPCCTAQTGPQQQSSHVALSWRGDGKYLAVLAPEAADPAEGANGAPQPSLVLRIYDREAGLTPHAKGRRAEDDGAVEGLVPGAVAWSTDGALIATARATGRKGKAGAMTRAMEVAFFERNGLRHRELALREEDDEGAVEVGALAWDAEAGVLAVALLPPAVAPEPPPRVQLWHRGNYHWYLKQELRLGSTGPGGGATHLLALRFDAERARRLHVLVSQPQEQRGQIQIEWRTLDFCWDTFLSPSPLRTAAVVDGRRLLLTPLSQAVVPPPMAAATLEASAPVTAVGFSAHATPPLRYHPHGGQQPQAAAAAAPVAVMAVLTAAGTVEVYDERRATVGEGEGGALLGRVVVDAAVEARQVAVLVEGEGEGEDGTLLRLRLLLAGRHRRQSVAGVLALGVTVPTFPPAKDAPLTITQQKFHPLPPSDGHSAGILRLQPWDQRRDAALLALEDGRVLQYTCSSSANSSPLAPHPHVPPLLEPCPWVHLLDLHDAADTGTDTDAHHHPAILVALSERGRLYANEHCLAPGGCGSFLPHPSFGLLLYATLGSRPQLRLVPYRALARLDAHAGAEAVLEAVGEGMEVVEPRALERGARLVAASPVAPTVVLQMPRGNLEAVYPRSLVLHAAARMLDAGRYGQALALLRRQNGDLNFLVDYDPVRFERVGCRLLVEQALLQRQEQQPQQKTAAPRSSSPMERDNRLAVFLAALHGRDSLLFAHGHGRTFLATHASAATSPPAAAATADTAPEWFPAGKRNRVCELVRGVLLAGLPTAATAALLPLLLDQPQADEDDNGEQEQEQQPLLPTPLLEPILTTLGRQDPPRFAAALRLIRQQCGRGRRGLAGEGAQRLIRYLAFFAPESEGGVDCLYAVALGVYDFGMARAVARLSPRMDPREYLPRLERWEGLRPAWRARAEVDLALKRPGGALRHMALSGGGEEDGVEPQEVLAIAGAHGLEEAALGLFGPPRRFSRVYARLLETVARGRAARGEHEGAVAAYLALAAAVVGDGEEADKPSLLSLSFVLRAAECARAGRQWGTALALASRYGREGGEGGAGLVEAWARQLVVAAGGEAAMGVVPLGEGEGEGGWRARLLEAARVGLEVVGDVKGAVALLVKARAWGEALRVAYGGSRSSSKEGEDLVAGVVLPAAVELAEELTWERFAGWRAGYAEGVPKLVALLEKVAVEDTAAREKAAEETRRHNGGAEGAGGSLFSAATQDSVGSAASYRSGASGYSNSSRHSRLTWATTHTDATGGAASLLSSSSVVDFRGGNGGETRQERRLKYKAAKRAKARPPTAREQEGRLRRELQGLIPSPAVLGEVASLVEALLGLGEAKRARGLLRAVRGLVRAVAARPLPPPPPPLPSALGEEGKAGGQEEEEEDVEVEVAVDLDARFEKALGRFVFLLGEDGGVKEEEGPA